MRTVTITVKGRVQGVGFRYALSDAAERAGVVGWARNRRDGSVEARLTGDDDAVADVVRWAHRGPPAAAVDEVGVDEAAHPEPFTGFDIRPTV